MAPEANTHLGPLSGGRSVTPEDEKHSHFFWSYAHKFRLEDRDFRRILTDRSQEGFEEDKFFIEKQQGVIDEGGSEGTAFILADNGLAMGRRLLDQKLAKEAAA
jgi:vanillate O-demethylase monooxygenase subunit